MTTAPFRSARDLISTIRGELQERRQAREDYRVLERELASYRTPHEVDDLLGSIKDDDTPEAQQIRDLLLDNLRPTTPLFRAA